MGLQGIIAHMIEKASFAPLEFKNPDSISPSLDFSSLASALTCVELGQDVVSQAKGFSSAFWTDLQKKLAVPPKKLRS